VRSSGATYALRLKPEHIDMITEGFPALTRILCQQFTRRLKEANDALREFRTRFALVTSKHLANDGEILFRQGDPSDLLYQLLVGTVEVERDGQVSTLVPDDRLQGFLDPEAYFRNRKHGFTVRAKGDCILVAVDQKHKETLVRCYPELASRIMEDGR
jgi:CRP-like cAMP-binding protein